VLAARRDEFKRRRDYLIPALEKIGFRLRHVPEGAFYLYMDCSALTEDSFVLSQDLLEKAGVAITPGLDFGRFQAEKYVRFAFTTGIENLQEGVKRISDFLGS
jgi:aspartate/methionine/tyrosine aminotransferase